ncbi:class I SAM-dependent methyltransferase [Ottowia testudinis]|uniref:S-adenosyl-L-methionine-dependent methyltransferase n=1 Tax=Ottowia testudinis TaxID=2816950 RepID=A0A975CK97_9BURK|nr:class I SAM-dependent methyltransferase [Ottowia testudinis]QTD47154.1 class I SAM-dependent methyltransferase [Ottowia testudinis]
MPNTHLNIVRQGEASRTALQVAQLRAVHALLDEPVVLDDPLALPILGAPMAAALRDDPFRLNDPSARALRASLVARARVAEDELARAVAAGVRQYVVLGAGLDTFACRNPYMAAGLNVFEVDHPATQAWKRQCLSQAGIVPPGALHFVPVDFESGALMPALAAAGLRADKPACFTWLGVTVYLTPEAVMATLTQVAALPAGSSITFDYRVPQALLNPFEQAVTELFEQQVAAQGEPWLSSFEPEALGQQLHALGFSRVDDPGADAINARYFPRRKDGLRCGAAFRFACARV